MVAAERIALVLAAGASLRWGSGPKALAPLGGATALGRIVGTLGEAGVAPIRVVLGAHAREIRDRFVGPEALPVAWIEFRDWASGRSASVRAGLTDLPAEAEVLLWPVDHPFVTPATVRRLLSVADSDDLATWVLPEYGGRGGHPVLLKPPAWRAIFDLGPDEPLRRLLARLGPQVRRVAVDDPGVAVNLNTPADLAAAREAGRGVTE
jgi:molybdenum cofactor cytidylyltransferase